MAIERKAWKTNKSGRNTSGNNNDASEANEREPENNMVVRRRAAQLGERLQVWKVNSILNAKRNASKLGKATMVVMG